MFILDTLLVGSLRFVFEKVAAAVDAEMQDDSAIREQLLEAQMRLELGEISQAEFAAIESDALARIRELKDRQGAISVASSPESAPGRKGKRRITVDVESWN